MTPALSLMLGSDAVAGGDLLLVAVDEEQISPAPRVEMELRTARLRTAVAADVSR
jgi:hypothetical protein